MSTGLYAGILGLILVGLSAYVIAGRRRYGVLSGDGGNAEMQRRIRMHGNFIEYAPMGLVLLYMVDRAGYAPAIVHGLGLLLVLGRLAHARALAAGGAGAGRVAGMAATLGMIAASSLLLLYQVVVAD